jgi:hypothetical protein
MQGPNTYTSERPNWSLGLRALLIAFALASVSGASHSPLPMFVAVMIAGWAVFKPLCAGTLLFSRTTLRWGGTTAIRIAALLCAAFVLSFAVNSSIGVIAMAGNALFLALVVVVAAMSARYGWLRARSSAPRAWSWTTAMVENARAQLAAVLAATLTR